MQLPVDESVLGKTEGQGRIAIEIHVVDCSIGAGIYRQRAAVFSEGGEDVVVGEFVVSAVERWVSRGFAQLIDRYAMFYAVGRSIDPVILLPFDGRDLKGVDIDPNHVRSAIADRLGNRHTLAGFLDEAQDIGVEFERQGIFHFVRSLMVVPVMLSDVFSVSKAFPFAI
ncbi:hypothetical protein Avi_3442 [Allorhizobium ampelinum S4]|uniref:Uncharacterized protein n=1 Tax=Allorhizobium ampelinum (strain ATCC BAA-846 / DSM 112012 / S4) TaxID=311402 RepID=B9JR53_ALLAM|nr:hypothetical protein Avi_3442 [Allorhizobium ampelinum S4]